MARMMRDVWKLIKWVSSAFRTAVSQPHQRKQSNESRPEDDEYELT